MSASMAADAVDLNTVGSSEARAGVYFSGKSSAQKTTGAPARLQGLTAVGFFGFEPTLASGLGQAEGGNSELATIGIILHYSDIPCCFYFATMPSLWKYPLTEARHARLGAKLERKLAARTDTIS